MTGARTRKRFFAYAGIAAVAGYLLFAYTEFQIELVVILTSAIVAGIAFFLRRHSKTAQPLISSATARDVDGGSYEDLLRERWKQDLDVAATGVRSPSVPSDESATINLDDRAVDPHGSGRD